MPIDGALVGEGLEAEVAVVAAHAAAVDATEGQVVFQVVGFQLQADAIFQDLSEHHFARQNKTPQVNHLHQFSGEHQYEDDFHPRGVFLVARSGSDPARSYAATMSATIR